jgi:CheY-like chemotaxis protein
MFISRFFLPDRGVAMHIHKILIVDDELPGGDLMVEALQTEGTFLVDRAYNGKEGLDKYMEERPDLVIMDMNMPIMDGYESSLKIKTFDPLARILVWTADTRDARAKKSLEDGTALNLLQKPLKLKDLLLAIHDTLPPA